MARTSFKTASTTRKPRKIQTENLWKPGTKTGTSVTKPRGQGVRVLKLDDLLPCCEINESREIYDLRSICQGKDVVDIGCGHGRNRAVVEAVGGKWVGVEPFEGGNHTVTADAENLPFGDDSFDVVIMEAVLEHIPDVGAAFSEVSRILRPNGLFVGYAAFMECFHEISYSHLSFRALEHYAAINDMQLEKISGGGQFGISYHMAVMLNPMPGRTTFKLVCDKILSGAFYAKAAAAYIALRLWRKSGHADARKQAERYRKLECLRQSVGFSYVIRKSVATASEA